MELNEHFYFYQSIRTFAEVHKVNAFPTSALQDCVYWGTDKKTFGDFEVEVTSTETSPAFTSRTVTVRHGKVTHQQPANQQSRPPRL